MRKCNNIPACAHWHILTLNNGVCVSLRVLCPRMSRMCTCLRLRAILVCPPASRVYVSVCVCTCVCVPGEPVAGQRFSSDQGYTGGGDADDRQPLRFCLPPLLLSSARL